VSRGTALHYLRPGGAAGDVDETEASNCSIDNLDWRMKTAMRPLLRDEGTTDQSRVVDYRSNRLFVFLDGPMSFHSVPFDNPDHTPDPKRAIDGGIHARRRILRSHTKVNERVFFNAHSRALAQPLELSRYARLMAPGASWSGEDARYVQRVIEPFYRERLEAYARAGARAAANKVTRIVGDVGADVARSTSGLLARLGLSQQALRPDYEVFRRHARVKLFGS
jgi:hypothetical protein